ncbi:MAG: four helix bundle protein [Planctomycetota bacterium]|nr:MAG: four helix bundle protein [Planctomycetota bacterium]
MKDFKELKVWQKSHKLVLDVHKATMNFPKEEMYGLKSQMRRAGYSIPANIAEGCGRSGDAELARFLQISAGSASELQYFLILAHDLQLLRPTVYENLTDEVIQVKRMLASFIKRIRGKS